MLVSNFDSSLGKGEDKTSMTYLKFFEVCNQVYLNCLSNFFKDFDGV